MIAMMIAMIAVIDCNDGYSYYSQTATVINITSVIDDINQYGDGCVYSRNTHSNDSNDHHHQACMQYQHHTSIPMEYCCLFIKYQ